MSKRFIQAATITCMLFLVMKIGSNPLSQASSGLTLQVSTDEPEILSPALKAAFQ